LKILEGILSMISPFRRTFRRRGKKLFSPFLRICAL